MKKNSQTENNSAGMDDHTRALSITLFGKEADFFLDHDTINVYQIEKTR